MKEKTVYIESLGCAKNTVDSVSMLQLLQKSGYTPVEFPEDADVIIVNTCGFIQTARDESIEVLQELSALKSDGKKLLIAAGCLPERDRALISSQVEGLDGIIGTRRWMDIAGFVENIEATRRPRKTLYHLPETATVGRDEGGVLRAAIQGGSAYLKIADGCRRGCAFCSIPLIKGTAVSRPPEVILEEAVLLQDDGIKELILIAQDTTDYGSDLGLKDGLAQLLENIVQKASAIPWIRLLYTYPGFVTDRLIDVMASNPQIVPYLDIPLQHAHPQVLKRMHRPSDMDWVYRTLEKMRRLIPELALRTTFIVGYPEETEQEFQTMLDFLSDVRFDHVGAFTYSFEPGTPGAPLGDTVPQEIKDERLERLMLMQEQISLSINQTFVGKEMSILIEGSQDGISIGRSYRDAPEIDGLVICTGEYATGELVDVRITAAMPHDLNAEPL